MNFSLSRLLVLPLMALLLLIQGCGDFLKGKPKTQDVIVFKTDDVECIKEVQVTFKKLMESDTSEKEIDAAFLCLSKTLDLFQKNAEGRTASDIFLSEELYIIFNKFFQDAKISQKATDDILLLKKAIFGGQANSVNKTELEQLKNYLKLLNVETKKLAPYTKLFKLVKNQGSYDQKTIDLGFKQLSESLKILLNSSKIGRSEYNFDDLKQLIASLNIIENEEDQKQMLLIENVIKLLSGVEALKTNDQYLNAIDSFVGIGKLYAQALYTDLKFEISSAEQLNKVIEFTEQLISILENSPQYKKNKTLLVKYIDPIVIEILKSQIIPLTVSESTFLSFYKTILIRVFNDQKNIANESLTEIKELTFKNIKRELSIYKGFQKFINTIDWSKTTRIDLKNLRKAVATFPFNKSEYIKDQTLQNQVVQALYELRDEALTEFSIIYNDKKMILSNEQNKSYLNWEDLSRAHFNKMLARELMLGWGVVDVQLNLKKSYLIEQGMVQWYADFKQFGIEMKLFDPRENNSGAKSFMEANLFTPYGNGDKQLNFYETFAYVNMLVSGGGEITNTIIADMKEAGCGLQELDVFGNPWLDEKCFIKQFRKKQSTYFSNTKNYSVFLNALNDQQFVEYYYDLMSVARFTPTTVGRVETADIRVLSMLIMYIESLYSRFDSRAPFQTFSPAEIRQSYPRFKAFVVEFAEMQAQDSLRIWDWPINLCGYIYSKDELLQEAFIFMVYNGRLPVLDDMNYITCKFNGLFTFSGEVHRKTIISTFKVLKTVLASKK